MSTFEKLMEILNHPTVKQFVAWFIGIGGVTAFFTIIKGLIRDKKQKIADEARDQAVAKASEAADLARKQTEESAELIKELKNNYSDLAAKYDKAVNDKIVLEKQITQEEAKKLLEEIGL